MKIRRCIYLSLAYVKNSVRSWYFIAAVVLYFFILFMSTYSDFKSSETAGAIYFLHYAFMNGSTSYFLPVICALVASTEFCREWKSGYLIFTYTRTGRGGYAASLHFSAAFVAFLVSIIGTCIYFAVICTRFPIISADVDLQNIINTYANGGLLKENKVFLFVAISIITQANLDALLASSAVFIALIFPDPYLTTVSPMVIYIVITNIMSLMDLPCMVNPYYVFSGFKYMDIAFGDMNSNSFNLFAGAYPILFTIAWIVMLSILMGILINRKYERREE